MIKAAHIHIQAKSREMAEQKLGEAFNEWVEANCRPNIVKFFEPVRWDRVFGDYNYNEYHTAMTFFYEPPIGLKEI